MADCHFASIFPTTADVAFWYLSGSQWGRNPIVWWAAKGLESLQTARRFPGKSLVERELFRVQLTTSRSDVLGDLALEKKIPRHSLHSLLGCYLHSDILVHMLSPSPLPFSSPLHTHTFTLFFRVLPCLLSTSASSSLLLFVSIEIKPHSLVSGDTITSSVPREGLKIGCRCAKDESHGS